jgi:hypothetical protein
MVEAAALRFAVAVGTLERTLVRSRSVWSLVLATRTRPLGFAACFDLRLTWSQTYFAEAIWRWQALVFLVIGSCNSRLLKEGFIAEFIRD